MTDQNITVHKGMNVFDENGHMVGTVAGTCSRSPRPIAIDKRGIPIVERRMAPSGILTHQGNHVSLAPRADGLLIERRAIRSHSETGQGQAAQARQTTPGDLYSDYFKVRRTRFLGLRRSTFFIPFDVIDAIVPLASLSVRCTIEECRERYCGKPGAVGRPE